VSSIKVGWILSVLLQSMIYCLFFCSVIYGVESERSFYLCTNDII
jgi:hypothetical protein